MSDDVSERVLQIAADVFETKRAALGLQSTPDDVENWDSLTHLNFVVALEESFDCRIEPEENERIFKKLGEAVSIVQSKVAGG